MAKINNKDFYNVDNKITLEDFVVGSDFDDQGKTKNYPVKSFVQLVNEANGLETNTYKYSDLGGEFNHEDEGHFTTNGVGNQSNVLEVKINRINLEGVDMSGYLLNFLSITESFLFKIKKATGNKIGFFDIESVTSNEVFITLTVKESMYGSFGRLLNNETYFLDFNLNNRVKKTSQLINDGEDGENPFISESDQFSISGLITDENGRIYFEFFKNETKIKEVDLTSLKDELNVATINDHRFEGGNLLLINDDETIATTISLEGLLNEDIRDYTLSGIVDDKVQFKYGEQVTREIDLSPYKDSTVLPRGAEGDLLFVSKDGSVNYVPDRILDYSDITETDGELQVAKSAVFSLSDVFDKWDIIVNGSQDEPLFPAVVTSNVDPNDITPQKFYNGRIWSYDAQSDRISLNGNYNQFSAFISPFKHENYEVEAVLSSSDNDNDEIGIVIGFYKDPATGYEYTLSVIRSLREQSGSYYPSYSVFFNISQNPSRFPQNRQKIVIDNSNAAPIRSTPSGWPGNQTKLNVVRSGNSFVIKTSQFGSSVLDSATAINLNLNDYPYLNMFKGGSNIGFGAISQKDAFISDIVFTGLANYIVNIKPNNVYEIWEYNKTSNQYVINSSKEIRDVLKLNRFHKNFEFEKTYYVNYDGIIKIGESPKEEQLTRTESFTLDNSMNDKVIWVGNTASTPIVITVGNDLIANFKCGFVQTEIGDNSFSSAGGSVIKSEYGLKIEGKGLQCFLQKNRFNGNYYLLGNVKP